MGDVEKRPVPWWRRGIRCIPFAAVGLCFLLPFFTASSCGSGQETTATGVQILAGSQLIAQQVAQPSVGAGADEPYSGPRVALGPAGPDAQAQKASDDARPWAFATILILIAGVMLTLRPRRRWRLTTIVVCVAAGASLVALVAALSAAPENVEPDKGVLLAFLILFLTVVWHGCALVVLTFRSANRANRSGSEKRPP